ncbi:hypothetical protein niasHT_010022 [Heterodera trifolii]|uniref:ENT domain-containing protein n=1 Tax=Heterodera trifolii TaxID=157864 RepID=A0ABD2M8G9_9BILA
MQPSTSNLGSKSIIDSYLNSTEDCQFLLRALEKQAFENVVFALRAQGPLTQYTELLLDHLKTALSIDDDEFNIKIRIASNNPHICRIAQRLNPSYDNDARWVSFAYDLTGIELAKIRKIGAVNNDPKLFSKHIRELHKHNSTLPNANDAFSHLMALPKQPYVPERLRKFLHSPESNEDIISTKNVKTVTVTTQKPTKNGVGRPRKRKRVEDEKRKKEVPLEKKKKEEEPLESEESAKNYLSDTQQKAKRTPFYKHNVSNSNKEAESVINSSLSHPNYHSNKLLSKFLPLSSADYPTSSSQLQHCHNLPIGPNNEAKCGFTNEEQSSNFDHGLKSSDEARRQENDETTFVCARVRPFHRAVQPKTRGTDKRLKTSSHHQTSHNQNSYSHFRQNTKHCGQTPIHRAKNENNFGQNLHCEEVSKWCKNHFEERRKLNDALQTPHSSKESVPSAKPSPLVSAHYVTHSSRQILRASNEVVEADHAYEKASSSLTIENNGTNAIVSSAVPAVIGNCAAPITVQAENGLVVSNGTCDNGTPSNHLTTLTTLDLLRTKEFIANQSISMDEVVETSGLDFLASTASLLAPMKPSVVKCNNDKISATSHG